jgi:hypothetical protein
VLVAVDDRTIAGFSGVVRVNPTTGQVNDLSLNGLLIDISPSGIAVVPVPEPISLTVALIVCAFLATSRVIGRHRA